MDIIVYLSVPILFLVFYITSKHFYHKLKNHPPIPFPALPFIGHLHMIKKPFHKGLSEISKKYGPIFFVRLGFRPVLVISSPSLASECFTKHDITFANRPSSLFGKHFGYNNTGIPWCSYGDHWRNLRKIATLELLSSNQLQILSHVRKDEILVLIRKLVHLARDDNDGVVYVKVALFEFMFNVLTGMICGKRYYGTENSNESDVFVDIYNETLKMGPTASIVDFMPFMKWFGFKDTEKKIMLIQEKRDKYMKNLLEEHRKVDVGDAGENKNMAHVLLSLQKQEPEYYTDEMINTMMSIHAADTLEWAFSLLLDNPDVLTKAQAEIDNIIGKESLINESDLAQLPYLRGIGLQQQRLNL
ncbi:hypothetical protein ACJIZ3_013621 [Penstemon smallii]|uniref:Cytochrome P450 n=1 Tax=Penstemon smallii TaxID=265156 RepID=A0ABD3RHJ0_9LAMI